MKKVVVGTKPAPTVKKENGMGTPAGTQKKDVATRSSFVKGGPKQEPSTSAGKKADMGVGKKK